MSEPNVDVDLSLLPHLPIGWSWSIAEDFCSVVASGSTPTADKMFGDRGEVPFIKVYNLTHHGALNFSIKPTFISRTTHREQLRRSITKPGDVLINIVGPPLGKVSIVPDSYSEWNINQAIVTFRPKEIVFNKYLAFAMLTNSVMNRVTRLAKATAGQYNIGVSMCRRLLPIPIAPLNEQRRIVAKIEELFSDLDAGVAALERAKANLKRYRATVLKAAVTGQLTAAWRKAHLPSPSGRGVGGEGSESFEPATKLLTRILAARRQKWEQDQLAKFAAAKKPPPKNWQAKYPEPIPPDTTNLSALPSGWCWASIEQCAVDVTVGHVGPMKNQYVDQGIPFLRSQNVRPLRFDREGLKFIPLDFHAELQKSKLCGGELLVVRSGNIGDACVYPGDEREANCADLVITRLASSVSAEYAAIFVVSPPGQRFVSGRRTGSALSHFNVGAMKRAPFPLPPLAEQAEIVAQVSEKLSQIEAAEATIDNALSRAARLRQSILHRAFTGRLVPQDPDDEPASVLLERIRAEQNQSGTSSNQSRRNGKPRQNSAKRTSRRINA